MLSQSLRETGTGGLAHTGASSVLVKDSDAALFESITTTGLKSSTGVNELLAQFLRSISSDARIKSIVIEEVRSDGTILSRAVVDDGRSFVYDGEPGISPATSETALTGGTSALPESARWMSDEISALMSAFDELDATADRIIASMDRSHDLLQNCIREANAAHEAAAPAIGIYSGATV